MKKTENKGKGRRNIAGKEKMRLYYYICRSILILYSTSIHHFSLILSYGSIFIQTRQRDAEKWTGNVEGRIDRGGKKTLEGRLR